MDICITCDASGLCEQCEGTGEIERRFELCGACAGSGCLFCQHAGGRHLPPDCTACEGSGRCRDCEGQGVPA